MVERIPLNDDWEFCPQYTETLNEPGTRVPGLEAVRLPHTVALLPHSYPSAAACQGVSGYRRVLRVPESWRGRHILLRFGAVAHSCTVYLNGREMARHACGYTAFTADFTGQVRYGERNVIVVRVDSTEQQNIPPFGGVIDYLTYGGIYREVTLEIRPRVYIEDIFAAATQADGVPLLDCALVLNRPGQGLVVAADLVDAEGGLVHQFEAVPLTEGRGFIQGPVPGARLWRPDDPALYTLRLRLYGGEAEQDSSEVRVGFRSCDFRADGFYLNGERLQLVGLNRHQSWPYVGYAMPARPQRLDADILKYELGLNAVRTSHYPQSHHFIGRCDEIGLLVFTELPGWQHIGDADWKAQAVRNVADMVAEYRNHPAIVLWGTRINESPDDDLFYQETADTARKLDPTRQTGGVRNFHNSRLLEDVYTYNDFSYNGRGPGVEQRRGVTSQRRHAYLVTEYNGHMFPTKSYDDEAHRLAHALRHARVLNDAMAAKNMAGSFGWVFTDYNTHPEFGSGDGICHHGVLDMFRNPKLAAAVYASRRQDAPFLAVSSSMDVGEHPATRLGSVYAFTNAEAVQLYKNGKLVDTFGPGAGFSALPHPPVCIDDLVGRQLVEQEGVDEKTAALLKKLFAAVMRYGEHRLPLREKLRAARVLFLKRFSRADIQRMIMTYLANWGSSAMHYRFDAVTGGRVVASVVREAVTSTRLEAVADTLTLHEDDTYDLATIRIRAVDQNGNTLPYSFAPVRLSVTGPLELVGPEVVPLRGGMAGAYVRTTGRRGHATLNLATDEHGSERITFKIE